MFKARKNHTGEGHTSRKRAERWFKRLFAAEIKREEERCRKESEKYKKELGFENNGNCEISYSPSNSPITERKDFRREEISILFASSSAYKLR
jgi:predicted ATPase